MSDSDEKTDWPNRLPRHGLVGIGKKGSDGVVQHGDALVVDAREQHGRRHQVVLDVVVAATRRVLLPHLVLLEAALQIVDPTSIIELLVHTSSIYQRVPFNNFSLFEKQAAYSAI